MDEKKIIVRGEAALILAIIVNSMGVLLMLQSGSGISAISSVPYAFSEVFPKLSLGTWTYIFQGLLVITLMVLKKRSVRNHWQPYSKVKITFDVTCLLVTACLTYFALGKILGLGIGTVVAAFTMGKGVSIAGSLIDKKMVFVSVLHKELEEAV